MLVSFAHRVCWVFCRFILGYFHLLNSLLSQLLSNDDDASRRNVLIRTVSQLFCWEFLDTSGNFWILAAVSPKLSFSCAFSWLQRIKIAKKRDRKYFFDLFFPYKNNKLQILPIFSYIPPCTIKVSTFTSTLSMLITG